MEPRIFKLYTGHRNRHDIYGCPADEEPDCAQPHNPAGHQKLFSTYKEINWCRMLKELERLYCPASTLRAGDILQGILVPSYSEVRSLAYRVSGPLQTGLTFDVMANVKYEAAAAFVGDRTFVTRHPGYHETDNPSGCSVTGAPDQAEMADMGSEDEAQVQVYIPNPGNRPYVGGRAGTIDIVIKSVPDAGVCADGPNFALRANYINHMECCHSPDCGKPCPC